MSMCKLRNCECTYRIRRGWCNKHYLRFMRTGDAAALSTKDKRPAIIENDYAKILLGASNNSKYATVDKEFAWLDKYIWCYDHGYARTNINGKRKYMHHFVIGSPPKGLITDHRDRCKLNNRRNNLIHTTQDNNVLNADIRRDNTSGYIGIRFDKTRNKWEVRIKDKFIGRFNELNHAATERRKAEIKYFGRLREYTHG